MYHREKLACQLEAKRIVDSNFKDSLIRKMTSWFRTPFSPERLKQVQIDLKYHSLSQSIDAVKTGDLNLITQSLPHVDVRTSVSLTLVAIERDTFILWAVYLKSLCVKGYLNIGMMSRSSHLSILASTLLPTLRVALRANPLPMW